MIENLLSMSVWITVISLIGVIGCLADKVLEAVIERRAKND